MRAAPAFKVSLRRFGAWRAAVWAGVACVWASSFAWAVTQDGPASRAMTLPMAILAGWAAWRLGRSLARQPPTDLRWDGQLWWLARSDTDPVAGRLSVAIDLGPWMLLRFLPNRVASRSRAIWLPVQRRGLEADWHALRCSVHSPVPPPLPGTAPQGARLDGPN
jgi:hypothetical protein